MERPMFTFGAYRIRLDQIDLYYKTKQVTYSFWRGRLIKTTHKVVIQLRNKEELTFGCQSEEEADALLRRLDLRLNGPDPLGE